MWNLWSEVLIKNIVLRFNEGNTFIDKFDDFICKLHVLTSKNVPM